VGSGGAVGGARELSDLMLVTGLVPETACLAGWIFDSTPSPVTVEAYASSLDNSAYAAFKLVPVLLTGFELRSNVTGGVELRLVFSYGKLEIQYGVSTAKYPLDP
jgi:hypothetical protein